MRCCLIAVAALAMLAGCGTGGVTTYQVLGDEMVPVMEAKQRFAGKGCMRARIEKNGDANVVVKQYGTSDWSLSRMFAWLGDVAGNLPIIGGGGTTNTAGMQGPTDDPYEMDCTLDGGGGGHGDGNGGEGGASPGENAQPKTRVIVVPPAVSDEEFEAAKDLLGAE